MPTPPLSEDVLRAAVSALEAFGGNKSAAAESLGLPRATFRCRLAAARIAGLMPNANPEIEAEAARQGFAPEHDMIHPVPDGYEVLGTSTYYGQDGKPKGQWVKSRIDAARQREMFEEAVAGFCDRIEPVEPIPPPEVVAADLMTVYPFGDPHIGMMSWGEETGADYDTKIAERLLTSAFSYLVDTAPPSGEALIILSGDNYHYDGYESVTPQHKNQLDTDTRYPKMVRAAIRVVRMAVARALQKHQNVTVIIESGNHDPASSGALREFAAVLYENEPRVTIDTSPAAFHYKRFGKCLIGTTHGDKIKPSELPLIMAVDRPKDWGETAHRHWIAAHVHHEKRADFKGVTWESLALLAPVDAWAAGHGYRGIRKMFAATWHKEFGETSRTTVNPAMLAA